MIRKLIVPLVYVVAIFVCLFPFYRITINDAYTRYTDYQEPANKAFVDPNFYECIIDAYNNINNVNIPYTDVLTDIQLQTITDLSCDGTEKESEKKITNISGLEKLTQLENLNLSGNLIIDINFKDNILLKKVDLSNNNISNLDFSNVINLISLIAYKNKIETINIIKNDKLENLNLSYNYISKIDLQNNTSLENLSLDTNKLTSLDLSKNINLKHLNLTNNLLEKIDLSNNILVETVSIYDNKLLEINLSKNINLYELNLRFNNLSKLNINNNVLLKKLYLSNNRMKDIDFSKNLLLEELDLSNNIISEVDFSNNKFLYTLNLSQNSLNSLDLTNNEMLTSLRVDGNPFKKNIIIYKDIFTKINDNFVKLPDGNETKITKLSSEFLTVDTLKERILSDKIGEFALNVSYSHDLGLYYNNYSGIYTVKVIELNSNEYEIDSKNGYIYIGNENDLDVIRNNINVPVDTTIDINLETNKLNVVAEGKIIKEFNLIRINSDYYDLSNNYIYTGSEFLDLDKINVINGQKEVKDNKLLIKYGEEVLDEFPIIFYKSNFYNLTDKYIYIGSDSFDIGKVDVVNGNKQFVDGKFLIKYGEEVLHETIIIGHNSTKYDLTKDYIYIGNKDFDINAIETINMEKEIKDNKLLLKFEDEIIKQYHIVGYNSDTHDLSKEYIYVGTNSFDMDAIKVMNMTKELKDNKLLLKYNEEVLAEYLIVGYNSDVYDLSKEYIYTGINSFDINDINVMNMTKEIKDNKLLLKYENILEEYLVINFNIKDFKVKNKNIFLYYKSTVTYDEFTSSITTNGVTYKIYNDNQEIIDGNLVEGMVLKIYFNDSLLDEYSLLNEYYKFSELLNVDETQKLIYKLKEGTTLAKLSSLIDTSGEIKIQNISSEYIRKNDNVGTKYKLIIEFSKTRLEYTLSIAGDVTCDGIVNIADVLKIADHTITEDVLDEIEVLSAEVTKDSNLNIADVLKIADYTIDNSIEIWK